MNDTHEFQRKFYKNVELHLTFFFKLKKKRQLLSIFDLLAYK